MQAYAFKPMWKKLGVAVGLACLLLIAVLWNSASSAAAPPPQEPGPGENRLATVRDGVASPDLGPTALVTWYVAPTGSDTYTGTAEAPFATIQHAVQQVGAGDHGLILIHAGVYTENLAIVQKDITLRGGYIVSDSQWIQTANTPTIVRAKQTVDTGRAVLLRYSDAALEDLVITGGHTVGELCWGAGVWATASDVVIRRSLITGNQADSEGCGSGGGVTANWDYGDVSLTLEDTVIAGNTALDYGGALAADGAAVTLTNVLIYDNISPVANSIAITNSSVTVQNSTIVDNPNGDQAIIVYDAPASTLIMRNTIMWGNKSNLQVHGTCANCVRVSYSDIQGGWPGQDNIDKDPLFVKPIGRDYHLKAWSPCIDTGTFQGAPDHDFEDDSRPQNRGVDIGADEFVGTVPGIIFLPVLARN
jgi:hypothetical protein